MDPLNIASARQDATALQENLLLLCRELSTHTAGWEYHDEGGVVWRMSPLPLVAFNSVQRTRLRPDQADAHIRRLHGWFKIRGKRMGWFIWSVDEPEDLSGRLLAHGFTAHSFLPALSLAIADAPLDEGGPAGLVFSRVRDEGDFDDYETACIHGMGWDDNAAGMLAFLEAYRRAGYADGGPIRHYLGRRNGRAVATGTLVVGGEAAGLYAISTAPEERHQGIGRAMTIHLLREAAAAGSATAVLQSSPMGFWMYKGLGFQTCGEIAVYIGP